MTEFIERLTKEEESDLLSELGYFPYDNDFCQGNKSYKKNGYIVYHTWNHNYSGSKDYDEDYIKISDFDIKSWGDIDAYNQTLFKFMFKKFDEEWANKAIKFFKGKKATAKVRFIETLIKNSKVETQEL